MKIFKSTPAWIISIIWLIVGLLGIGIIYGAYKECVLKFSLMECWGPMFLFFLPGYPWWAFMITDTSGYYSLLVFAFLGTIINSIIVFLIVRAIHALIAYMIEKFRRPRGNS